MTIRSPASLSENRSSSSSPARLTTPVEAGEPADQPEVLPAGEQLVDRRRLAGEAHAAPDDVGVARRTSCPATRPVPLVGPASVVIIRTVVVLPAPLGPSRPSTRALRDREAHSVDGDVFTEVLDELDGLDGRTGVHAFTLKGGTDSDRLMRSGWPSRRVPSAASLGWSAMPASGTSLLGTRGTPRRGPRAPPWPRHLRRQHASPDGVLFARAFVRSPFAHATLTGRRRHRGQQAPGRRGGCTAGGPRSPQPGFQFFTTQPPGAHDLTAGRGQGAVRGRGSGRGRRGDPGPGRRRGRARRRRLRPPLDVVVDMEAAVSHRAPRCSSTTSARQRRTRGAAARTGEVLRGSGPRRARADRQPAPRGGADGGQRAAREPGGPDQDHDVTDMGLHPDAARRAGLLAAPSTSPRTPSASSPRTSAAPSAARPGCPRSTWSWPQRHSGWAGRCRGPRRGPRRCCRCTAGARSSSPSSASTPTTVGSPGCAAGCSATAAPTAASGGSSRSGRPTRWPTGYTTSQAGVRRCRRAHEHLAGRRLPRSGTARGRACSSG